MSEVTKLDRIEAVLLKLVEVSDRLARCAEAVSNPTYAIYEQEDRHQKQLMKIKSIRSVHGNIIITVARDGAEETMPMGTPLLDPPIITEADMKRLLDETNGSIQR